jgi:hypothetical protein
MRVAVLGGGLLGCCTALALAERGVHVTVFDRNIHLMTRAAVANEGKIHLGYMYAADPSLRTAKAMMRGALAFGPFFCRHLGISLDQFELSTPAAYGVHRDSQRSVEEVEAYLEAVHELILNHSGSKNAYLGLDLRRPITRWISERLESELNAQAIKAAFDTPEVAIEPVFLTDLVRTCVTQTPAIEVRTDHLVSEVEDADKLVVRYLHDGNEGREKFDQVVNALWDGRIAIDDARGNRPTRPWIHRLKYGVDIRSIRDLKPIQSITIVSGPFGEVVNYANGSIYLTWYPSCLMDRTQAVRPPHWRIQPAEPLRSRVLRGTFDALAGLVPALGTIRDEDINGAVVRGGPIVAWGKTDIDDPQSELHRRYEIGVTSEGRYHSIDPGKLTTVPLFASQCAERIAGTESRMTYLHSGRVCQSQHAPAQGPISE